VQKDNYVCEPQVVNVGNIYPSNGQNGNVYDVDGISPTINAGTGVKGNGIGSNNAPKVIIQEPIVYDDYNSRISADQDAINTLTCNCGASAERNGVKIIEPMIVEDFYQSREPRVYTETAPTIRSERVGLKAADGEVEYPCSTRGKQVASAIRASIYKQGSRNLEENVVNGLGYEGVIEQEEPKIRWRIRKLTDKECWRLMNFSDSDNDRASKYVSASALYKQAGNSIIVACLIALMSSLFIEDGHKAEVWTKYMLHFDD
jgi:DNA (cytosine-5)-methyltransferase 1